jgi:phosphonate transport system substrate-binding protein
MLEHADSRLFTPGNAEFPMSADSTRPDGPTPFESQTGPGAPTVGANGRKSFSVARVLALVMPLGLLVAGVIVGKHWAEMEAERKTSQEVLERKIGIGNPIQNRLADCFDDADGDLVADAPKDPKKLMDPDVLMFSNIAGIHPKDEAKVWKKLCEDLAKATGKKVEYMPFAKIDEQLAALKAGRLHIAGLNTGAVPVAVDECGFVPICTLGRADGGFGYSMMLIVPAKSPIKSPADLRGRTIALKDVNSNSGFKAPIVTLLNEFGLRPTRDYDWVFTYEHDNSIRMTAKGECDAAAVASDLLAAAISRGDIKETDVRVIYKSNSFPPAAIGCPYNLRPELVAKIKSALLSCDWKQVGLTEQVIGGGATKFVPISYREAFAAVRQIDDTMGVRHHVD